MELPGPSILSTCSRPLAELLKIRTWPDFDDVESRARLTFAEHALARRIIAQHSTLREETQFVFLQPREDWDFRERLSNCSSGFWHEGYCIGGLRRGCLSASLIRSLPRCGKSHRAGDRPFSAYLALKLTTEGYETWRFNRRVIGLLKVGTPLLNTDATLRCF